MDARANDVFPNYFRSCTLNLRKNSLAYAVILGKLHRVSHEGRKLNTTGSLLDLSTRISVPAIYIKA